MKKKWIKPETRVNERGYLEIVTPPFSSREEEADWWDNVDTSEIMEKGESVELIFTKPRVCCKNCGSAMRSRHTNIDLLGGKIVVRKVKQYRCPRCGHVKLSQEGATEVKKIEKALKGKVAVPANSVKEKVA